MYGVAVDHLGDRALQRRDAALGVDRVGGSLDCVEYAPGSAARGACELQRDIRSGIGLFAVGVVWIGGTLVLGVMWLVKRPPKRVCPRCANDVRKGLTACPSCGYEFGVRADGEEPH